jgi:hypothetical protein
MIMFLVQHGRAISLLSADPLRWLVIELLHRAPLSTRPLHTHCLVDVARTLAAHGLCFGHSAAERSAQQPFSPRPPTLCPQLSTGTAQ